MPLEAWREQALRELRGAPLERLTTRTGEGLLIEALGSSLPQALPGRALLLRDAGWKICQEYSEPDAAAAGREIAVDLGRGAQAVWLRLDERVASGVGGEDAAPVGLHGVVIAGADDLAAALARVNPTRTPVSLAVGAAGLAAKDWWREVMARRGLALADSQGQIGCDPLGALAQRGALAWPIEQALSDMSEVACWARGSAPGLRTALVDVGAWHEAGATAADQLAALLATGLAYLRALTQRMTVTEAAGQMSLALAVGRDLFVEVAKLRAARLCWARVVAACGGPAAAQRTQLHARGSWRERTVVVSEGHSGWKRYRPHCKG